MIWHLKCLQLSSTHYVLYWSLIEFPWSSHYFNSSWIWGQYLWKCCVPATIVKECWLSIYSASTLQFVVTWRGLGDTKYWKCIQAGAEQSVGQDPGPGELFLSPEVCRVKCSEGYGTLMIFVHFLHYQLFLNSDWEPLPMIFYCRITRNLGMFCSEHFTNLTFSPHIFTIIDIWSGLYQ